jgi:cytochrome c peroxidase
VKDTDQMRARMLIALAVMGLAPAWCAEAATATVGQEGQHFDQKTLTAGTGDVVVFQNNDTVRHNIKIYNENDEVTDLGLQDPGQSLTYKLDKPGHYRARCGIHPSMKLSITVQ